jgi:basic amino acid/polyamine antiporter, APA family
MRGLGSWSCAVALVMHMTPGVTVSRLGRSLGLWTAIALVVGQVIGVGIFLTPADMARTVGSPFWLLVIWSTMALMAISGALCYGELAARFPEAGGGYVYLREAYGPTTAFLYGWKSLIVMDPGLTASLAVGLAGYVAYIIGLSPSSQKGIAILAIVVIAAANIAGARLGAGVLRALTFLKVAFLAFLIVWAFLFQLGDWTHFVPLVAQRPGSAPFAAAFAGGMVSAFFSFGGWWDAAKLAGEVREPERVIPKALVLGVSIVTAVYVLTSAAFLYLVPLESVKSGEAFAAQAGEVLFGRAGASIFAWIVVISVLSSMSSLMMSAPRVYYAMAKDGLFPAAMAAVHPRFGTPARAIALQAVLASVLVAIGTFSQIIAYFIFVTVSFVGLTVAAVFVMRRREARTTGYRTPGYPVTPIIFLALVAMLLFLLAAQRPREAGLGVVAVALGWPVYRLAFRRRAGLHVTEREGQ